MEVIQYAIIDGAIEEGLLEFLEKTTPAYCCMYAEPIQPDLVSLAPYLVEATPEVEAWLQEKDSPWGIYLTSELSLRELQQHFRHYLWIIIPEQKKPVLMRYYDPRNIWAITDILTERQLYSFLKPINKVSTYYDGMYEENDFPSIRNFKPTKTRRDAPTLLTLTYRQYKKLEHRAQENYIKRLSFFITESCDNTELLISSENISPKTLAEEYFSFCQSLNITDDISIRNIVLALLRRGISDTRDIPEEWYNLLSDQTDSDYNRVQKIVLREFGFTPQ